jgi:hypothetical protein
VNADLAARRTAAAAVLADYRRELLSAPLTRPPGREWMLRLATELESLLEALNAPAVLGAEPESGGLNDGQRKVLGQALADAADYREARGGDSYCAECEASPAGLCDLHAADMDQAGAYLELARDLGIEVDR